MKWGGVNLHSLPTPDEPEGTVMLGRVDPHGLIWRTQTSYWLLSRRWQSDFRSKRNGNPVGLGDSPVKWDSKNGLLRSTSKCNKSIWDDVAWG
jgi:hypothetical protein